MKKSTAKIAYMYLSNIDNHVSSENAQTTPTAHFYLPRNIEEIKVFQEFGLVGLLENHSYTLQTRFFHNDIEVGFPADVVMPTKILSFFANTGEYAFHTTTTERFLANANGYYRVEAKLYESAYENGSAVESEKLIDDDNIVHTIEIYIAVASKWSD